MPFLRFTRDRRGYENTFLLHATGLGERPRVLYWYRSAPGVRVGRPALDEDAIRTIEEQHPEVEFDWPHILEVGAATPAEIEDRPQRPRPRSSESRRPREPEPRAPAFDVGAVEASEPALRSVEGPIPEEAAVEEALGEPEDESLEDAGPLEAPPVPRAHDLLEELVGREIATRLHARYAEIIARIHRLPGEHASRDAWQARAESLNPDNWVTPDEVLAGVQRADALFDALRKELLGH